MNALKKQNVVTFSEELEHIKTYLTIEQVRFGDKLKVNYQIDTMDFSIPVLLSFCWKGENNE